MFREAPISTFLGILIDDMSFQTSPSEMTVAMSVISTCADKLTVYRTGA